MIARVSWIAALVAGLTGCGAEDLTELVVVIDTDLAVPTELDGIRLAVDAPSGMHEASSGLGETGDPELPLSFSLEHGGHAWLGPVTVTAEGTLGGVPVVAQTKRTSFVRGERRVLEIFLGRDCISVMCAAEMTCDGGSCVSIDVPPESLPRWNGEVPPRLDAGPRSDASMDASVDGGGDSGLDGGPIGPCGEGLTECGEMCVDVSSSPMHCGACDRVCGSSWADPTCAAGACALACDSGFADCNADATDGCETDLGAASDCGTCGTACPAATPLCARQDGVSSCVSACPLEAPSECGTSCVDTTTDLAHCGGCGAQCNPAHGSGQCAGGVCLLAECDPGWADCNADPADGCEVDLGSTEHCGACGNVCALDHAAAVCEGGSCAIGECETGWGDCDANPLDGCEQALITNSDCGGCGMACTRPNGVASCTSGSCELVGCTDGWADCDGDGANGCETDLGTSSDCGACGTACPAAEPFCTRSGSTFACSASCADLGLTECGTSCVDTTSSLEHCGGCGMRCAPPNGMGACVGSACAVVACDSGHADCNGAASDGCEARLDSVAHCGSCGTPCSYPNAVESCAGGTCSLVSCDAGFGDCDGMAGTGCEQELNTLSSCGSCGTACARPNATASCSTGTCVLVSCNPGSDDCDASPMNGCEDLSTDPANCGMCANVCRGRPNASGSCADGRCGYACNAGYADCNTSPGDGCECGAPPGAVATCSGRDCAWACAPGFTDCDMAPGNGCEVSTGTDPNQCGSCGNVCPDRPNSSRRCTSGTCSFACDAGYGDCNSTATDGCETSLLTTVVHCGACGNACPDRPNSSPLCTAGACAFACDAGFADCNGVASDGCEVDTRASLGNCGACGNVCPTRANASRTCAAGACGYVCNTEYGDCNGLAGDGCETNTSTSLSHCGMCTNACPSRANADETCVSGMCGYTCMPPYGDCNGSAVDGCEADTQSSLTHCGTCGTSCPTRPNATIACSTGTCTFTCAGTFDDCNGSAADGCEENTAVSLSHCGTCGVSCPPRANASIACSAGTCTFMCNGTYRDCNGGAADGCEADTSTSTAHCGTCGMACVPRANASIFCAGGSCGFTCNAGFADCNGIPTDGCEASLATLSSCGTCGATCEREHASESCSTGSCVLVACDAGWVSCNGVDGDGCEIDTMTDRMNCGGCGVRCTGSQSCMGGTCA